MCNIFDIFLRKNIESIANLENIAHLVLQQSSKLQSHVPDCLLCRCLALHSFLISGKTVLVSEKKRYLFFFFSKLTPSLSNVSCFSFNFCYPVKLQLSLSSRAIHGGAYFSDVSG